MRKLYESLCTRSARSFARRANQLNLLRVSKVDEQDPAAQDRVRRRIQIALVLAGLAILTGLYYGNPGKRPRGAIIILALVIAAAFLFAAIDRFTG